MRPDYVANFLRSVLTTLATCPFLIISENEFNVLKIF